MHTRTGVFASTAALAGAAGFTYGLIWAILWLAIVIALFDTVFQLIRAIGEGPARGARPVPLNRPPAPTMIDLP
jgi:uncharacterized membrane protein